MPLRERFLDLHRQPWAHTDHTCVVRLSPRAACEAEHSDAIRVSGREWILPSWYKPLGSHCLETKRPLKMSCICAPWREKAPSSWQLQRWFPEYFSTKYRFHRVPRMHLAEPHAFAIRGVDHSARGLIPPYHRHRS